MTPWVTCTRAFLDSPANAHINGIMWSWCSIDGHDAQRYVDNMEILVSEYPSVQFIFMTGHAQGQGEGMTPDSVHYNNQLIRQHCLANRRVLFDFADIEAYDPDDAYFWDLTGFLLRAANSSHLVPMHVQQCETHGRVPLVLSGAGSPRQNWSVVAIVVEFSGADTRLRRRGHCSICCNVPVDRPSCSASPWWFSLPGS